MSEHGDREVYRERQGRLILENPNIVEKDGVIVREDVVYKCPCGQRICYTSHVSARTYHDHMDRAIMMDPDQECKAAKERNKKATLQTVCSVRLSRSHFGGGKRGIGAIETDQSITV